MSVSSRVQYAVIAAALLPCWAAAQSNFARNAATDAAVVGSTVSSPVGVAADVPGQLQSNAANADVAAAPQPNLETDPIPADANTPASAPAPSDQVTPTAGPTSAAATAGIRPHTATENLTRQQLADRAAQDHSGLGRNAVLMIIGGAAIVAGAIVGGSAGTALIVVGAVIGITGLVLVLA